MLDKLNSGMNSSSYSPNEKIQTMKTMIVNQIGKFCTILRGMLDAKLGIKPYPKAPVMGIFAKIIVKLKHQHQ